MKSSPLFFYFLFLSFAIISCSAPKQVVVQQVPIVVEKERVFTKSFDAVWQSAIEWFATHNTPIKNLDRTSGLISTEYSVPIGEANRYMQCGSGTSNFVGKTEMANYYGNFNVIVKKVSDSTTKVSVNVFFGCTENVYKYKSLISTEYVLQSSTRKNCMSMGALEREILNYLEASN